MPNKKELLNIQMVDLINQHAKIESEYTQAVKDVVNTASFINGPAVKQFEVDFAHYLEVKHTIGCGNGTDALQIALMALNLKPGDEVITTSFTFVATAEVVKLLGLKLVLVEPDPDTFNINPQKIEQAISPQTKAIIPVHLYGQAADMDAIMKIAEKRDIWVIEDSAQAIGGSFQFPDGSRKKLGTIGHIGCTSFFPSKNLGAMGDGGALMTNDDSLAEEIRQICNHGAAVKYHHDTIGVNSRLDSVQAALLRVKLKYLDSYIQARRTAADFYDLAFEGLENVVTPYRSSYAYHAFHQYTLKILQPERNQLKTYLQSCGIPSMVYYPVPLHLQKAYAGQELVKGSLPISEHLSDIVLSLPMHTELSTEQLTYITQTLADYVKKY
jgi:dTDP-4-amino-4,6-dideoxygalactose transaminase